MEIYSPRTPTKERELELYVCLLFFWKVDFLKYEYIDGIKSVRLEIELKNKDITRILMQPRRISFVLIKYF